MKVIRRTIVQVAGRQEKLSSLRKKEKLKLAIYCGLGSLVGICGALLLSFC